jgi:beta-glucanase (GH16 family)
LENFIENFNEKTVTPYHQINSYKINGESFHVVDIKSGTISEAFSKPIFFILNIAVGGNWPGPPNDETQFPQKMYVDYIRVYPN